MENIVKPLLLTGFGDINFGKQYRQGNRVYSSEAIAMSLCSSPVGNMGGIHIYMSFRQKNKEIIY